MKKTDTEVSVSIPAIEIKTFQLKIVGDTPLISHAWDEKTKRQMLEKQMKKASTGKEARNPFNEFVSSLYWLTEKPENPTIEDIQKAKFGFPVIGFKAAAVSGGFRSGVVKNKTMPNGVFHILGEFAEIKGTPEIREDMVRIGMGVADIRYRGEFKEWSTTLTIRYNSHAMSMEQIINLFNIGGFACGVGEWRSEKGGNNGMFHVE